ncbi:extracellular solute-binding protein [Paenibacillus antri]|uniref:Extracellular solute-binding protein n=1 Tax=Paenibacillus antri TaxID=2582848 RepID=A0A5R9GHZ2_9BACL|nr:ABC transporter substrate-binding protein [Paenibacillus antri]TLS54116.1 extracellular solute-binding protein [Paenibacillus antri]
MKRRWTVTICAAMVLLLIAGCMGGGNGGGGEGEGAGQGEGTQGVVSFSAFAPQLVRIENMDTNLFTKYVEETVGIDIQWVLAPSEGANERKQLLLASGDYPDVFIHGDLTKEEQLKYGQQGVLIPLNDLIEQYGPNIKNTMDMIEEYTSEITAPDGNIYALPQVNECYHCMFSQKMWINAAWLEALGMSMPTTTEEFYQVLKAFKEKDPNGNGVADEIPLSGFQNSWHGNIDGFLMNAFIYNNSEDYFTLENGKVDIAANKEQWREGLRYLNKLYAEGLIDPAAFTQDEDALKQIANNANAPILGAYAAGHVAMGVQLLEDNNHADYHVVPPLKGPDGTQLAAYYPSIGRGQFAITNKATEEQRIAAIKLADLMATEEATIFSVFGPEGDYWRPSEAGEIDFHGRPAKYTNVKEFSTVTTWNVSWDQLGPSVRTSEFRESFATPEDEFSIDGYEKRLFLATQLYEPHKPAEVYPLNIFMDPADAQESNRLRTTINDYIQEHLALFVTGNRNLDTDWDAYVKGLDGLGLEQYLAIYQKAYDALPK